MRTVPITAILTAALSLAACTARNFEPTVNTSSGLGFPEKLITLEAGAGERNIQVLATHAYQITSDGEWLSYPATGPAGRDGFMIHYAENESFPRMARIVVTIEETAHKDTLTLRQKGGITPQLSVPSPSVTVKGSAAGECRIQLETNLPDESIVLSWESDDAEEWFSNPRIEGSVLSFSYEANPTHYTRRGSILASYTDAFGTELSIPFQLIQLSDTDSAGATYTLEDFFALATESGTAIADDIIIEGIVVSDKENGNCGDNTQTSTTSIDYSVCRRTVYLEAPDGSRGLCIETVRESDNIFLQGDRVKLSVRGATLYRSAVLNMESDPVFYTLTGVKGNMSMEIEHLGRSGIPVKEKSIGALKDEDIFTYVTIKECELPVRKGSLTPVSEQFTAVGGSDKVSKFGILVHDIRGGSIYLYTNTTCPYRRDGSVLPQGSGKLSGVVVHEQYPRFSYDDDGMGRYQLRHTAREDFQLARTMQEDSFSGIICEWRYISDKNLERYYATDGDTEAYFEHSFVYPNSDNYIADGRAGKLPINKMSDYSYLGPVGADNAGNRSGLGVIKEDGTDWMSPEYNGYNSEFAANINADGMGKVPTDAGSAWSTNINARDGKPMYMTFVFSTQGISSARMSMQISSINFFYGSTQKVNGIPTYLEGPRYWLVQYSTDGTEWHTAASYSLPEFCQTTPMTQLWQTAGFKPVNVPLPASELLGREKVWIRIIPEESLLTGSQTEYVDSSIKYPKQGSFPTAWNYVCIRYNTREPSSGPSVPGEFDGGTTLEDLSSEDYNWWGE